VPDERFHFLIPIACALSRARPACGVARRASQPA
jgi:hypothetical protein